MSDSPLCYVVDDDPVITSLVGKMLGDAGWQVIVHHTGADALADVTRDKPDCVLLDIMMPEMDGLELCKYIRERDELADTVVIMLSAKSYEFDRRRAYQFGANGYILKPIDFKTFTDDVRRIVEDKIVVRFWGVHGTLPVPGKNTIRYGGNTSCVSLQFQKDRLLIFDAGSGIKLLSDYLLEQQNGNISGNIFISHSHWDHINAIPFFVPLYRQGNEFQILGPAQGNVSVMEMISAQMDDVYFPITMKEFGAKVTFQDLREDTYDVDGIEVKTMMLSHPGYCLGYRVNYKGRSICYITDNELFPAETAFHDDNYNNKLEEFVRAADILITDTTYFDDEYITKVGWGHSCLSEVTRLAHNAGVKSLYLFHHDPDHSDDDIDQKLEMVNRGLKKLGSTTVCVAPAESEKVLL